MSVHEGLTLKTFKKPLFSSNIQLALLQLCSLVHMYFIIRYGRIGFFQRNVIYNGDNDLHMVDIESPGTKPPPLSFLIVRVVIIRCGRE
jgi:hypothetical protein